MNFFALFLYIYCMNILFLQKKEPITVVIGSDLQCYFILQAGWSVSFRL